MVRFSSNISNPVVVTLVQVVVEELLRDFLPRKRQILLFSATFPVTVKDFRDRYIPEPYEVREGQADSLNSCCSAPTKVALSSFSD